MYLQYVVPFGILQSFNTKQSVTTHCSVIELPLQSSDLVLQLRFISSLLQGFL